MYLFRDLIVNWDFENVTVYPKCCQLEDFYRPRHEDYPFRNERGQFQFISI